MCSRGHLQQAVEKGEHFCEGTHRLAEPVSNTTLNIWAGKPIPISPKYCVYWEKNKINIIIIYCTNSDFPKPASSSDAFMQFEYSFKTHFPYTVTHK